MPPVEQLLAVFAIAAFAGFIQGVSGFGAVIVALPLLILALDIKSAIPLTNLIALSISVITCVNNRDSLRWSPVSPLLLASIPGVPAGLALLLILPASWLKLILSSTLIALGLFYLSKEQRGKISLSRNWAYPCGFLSGVLGGSVGSYGPPVVVYLSSQDWPIRGIVTAMALYFAFMACGIGILHFIFGLISSHTVIMASMSLPFMFAGALTGGKMNSRLGRQAYRRINALLLLALAMLLLSSII